MLGVSGFNKTMLSRRDTEISNGISLSVLENELPSYKEVLLLKVVKNNMSVLLE